MTIHNPWDHLFIDPDGRVRKLERVRTLSENWSELYFTPLERLKSHITDSIPWSEKTGLIAQLSEEAGWSQQVRNNCMHLTDQDITALRGKFVYGREQWASRTRQFFELYAPVTPFTGEGTPHTRVRLFNIFNLGEIEDLDIHKDGTVSKMAHKEGFFPMLRKRFEEEVIGSSISKMSAYLLMQTRIPNNEVAIYNKNGLSYERWMRAAGLWMVGVDPTFDAKHVTAWMSGEDPSDRRAEAKTDTFKVPCVADFRNHRFFKRGSSHPCGVYRVSTEGTDKGLAQLWLKMLETGKHVGALVWMSDEKCIHPNYAAASADGWSFSVAPAPEVAIAVANLDGVERLAIQKDKPSEEPKERVIFLQLVGEKRMERISVIRCPECGSEGEKSLAYTRTASAPIELKDGCIEVDTRKETRGATVVGFDSKLFFTCSACSAVWPLPKELLTSVRFKDTFIYDLEKVKKGLKKK